MLAGDQLDIKLFHAFDIEQIYEITGVAADKVSAGQFLLHLFHAPVADDLFLLSVE